MPLADALNKLDTQYTFFFYISKRRGSVDPSVDLLIQHNESLLKSDSDAHGGFLVFHWCCQIVSIYLNVANIGVKYLNNHWIRY